MVASSIARDSDVGVRFSRICFVGLGYDGARLWWRQVAQWTAKWGFGSAEYASRVSDRTGISGTCNRTQQAGVLDPKRKNDLLLQRDGGSGNPDGGESSVVSPEAAASRRRSSSESTTPTTSARITPEVPELPQDHVPRQVTLQGIKNTLFALQDRA